MREWRERGVRAVAALAVLAVAACASSPPATDGFRAGETWRTASLASAAARSGGDPTLRIVVWYPASRAAHEATVAVGAPDRPVFVAGRVARDAPWADAGRHPVVVVSHGYGGAARQLTWLGSALARAGYVAIAVDHPGTNGVDGITAEGTYAAWERAVDLRTALDAVARDPVLGPRLDLARVGAAGFSLGGWTAALLAGARTDFAAFDRFCAGPARDSICEPQREYPADFTRRHPTLAQPAMRDLAAREHADHRDPRVRAVFLIAPALAQALDRASLASIRIPVAVLVGSADPVTRAATNADAIAAAVPGAMIVTLPGVAHYDFLSECGAEGRHVAAAYCTDGAGTRRAETHAATIAAARRFFDATLR